MTDNNAKELAAQLIQLGFEDSVSWLKNYHHTIKNNFTIYNRREKNEDQLSYALHYVRNEAHDFVLNDYALTIRHVPVPSEYAGLEKILIRADELLNASSERKLSGEEIVFCVRADDAMIALHNTDPGAAEILMFKYWPPSAYMGYIADETKLKEQYELSLSVLLADGKGLNAGEAYDQLKDGYSNTLSRPLADYNTFQLHSDHTIDVVKSLQVAGKEDFLWFGYPVTGESVRGEEIIFFESKADAMRYSTHQALHDEQFQVLPIPATALLIQDYILIDIDNAGDVTNIQLQVPEILAFQEVSDLNRNYNMLESAMREQHWKEVEVSRFANIIEGLQDMASYNEEWKQTVKTLINDYWPDLPNPPKLLFNNNENIFTMKENLEYLQDKLKNHGFGESLYPELEAQLKKGAAEFSLAYKGEINKKEFEATLHFKKSDKSENVFFNSYDASVQTEKDAKVAQSFYINDGRGVTVKEAYNLLNGRAVFKELTNKDKEEYKAWIQLDFTAKDKNQNYERKLYNQNYGYDLKETLSYFPVKEMLNAETAKDLIKSLEKGNVQMVTLQTPDKDVKIFIEANPKYKTLNLYSGKMQAIGREQKQELMQNPSGQQQGVAHVKEQHQEASKEKDQKQDVKKNNKVDLGDDLDSSKKKSRKNRMSM